jgi:hypothetical protein
LPFEYNALGSVTLCTGFRFYPQVRPQGDPLGALEFPSLSPIFTGDAAIAPRRVAGQVSRISTMAGSPEDKSAWHQAVVEDSIRIGYTFDRNFMEGAFYWPYSFSLYG